MPEPDSVSTDDLRKAVLNVADAVRLTSEALERTVAGLSAILPAVELGLLPRLRESVRAANGRLSAAVDLLVKEDAEHSP